MSEVRTFTFVYSAEMCANHVGEVMIYSVITSQKHPTDDGSITAKEFDAALKKVADAKRLDVRINSPGGSVFQAVSMRDMLIRHKAKEKHIYIEGQCASAATDLACIPGAKVHICQGSMYMIHNPQIYVCGDARRLEIEVNKLRKMEKDCYAMYAERTGQNEKKIKEWMDAETWFTAEEAVKFGFADDMGREAEAVACAVAPDTLALMREQYTNVPAAVMVAESAPTISNTKEPVASPAVTEHKPTTEGEGTSMETNTNPTTTNPVSPAPATPAVQPQAVNLDEIRQQAIAAERTRIAEIEALTEPGFEQMAADAKANGTSAQDFFKAILAEKKNRPAAHMQNRQNELAPAQNVGNAADDPNAEANMEKQAIDEIVNFAKGYRPDNTGDMF